MSCLQIPAFGEESFFENQENATARVWTIANAAGLFDRYCTLYLENGYTQKEYETRAGRRFAALQKGSEGVFLNAYSATDELCIVQEENCPYFAYEDLAGEALFPPQITQVKLKDYGMSYVIRLFDGRFVLIDGGFIYDSDCDALRETLLAQSAGKKPVIAAWILTHQHEDHFHCFLRFMEKYAGEAVIEKVLFNFPAHDDFAHYPELARDNSKIPDSRSVLRIPQLYAWLEKYAISTFTPHTGQKYRVGDAEIEFLASMDDTIHVTQNGNATSLVFRMELGSQVILWTADAGCSYARLDERYGCDLRADILQIPHHGFQSGKADAEIRTYDLVDPAVCLLPASRYVAYTFFCMYREGTRHLMRSPRVRELIDGEEQRTIVLPYTAREGAFAERESFMRLGAENSGARSWVFTNLSTARPEELCFTLLNMTVLPVRVRVELYFEDKKQAVRSLETEILGSSLKICPLTGGENAVLPPERHLHGNAPLAVRFLCDTPIVVSHPTHNAAYHSTQYQ
ncbi:MAG: MBL fold metallo-hydrolase [Ruminococcaceae bacterium]|nr:MBL fold metallo-hydrolase [Oscillospiraceae bacterium]